MEKNIDKSLIELIALDSKEIVFLCGAGISLDTPTSLPTVYSLLKETLVECNVDSATIEEFSCAFSRPNYRFESLVDEIRKKNDSTLKIAKIFNSESYNKIHSFLAQMMEKGATVITTNFDNCIENAFDRGVERFVYTGVDASISNECKLIKIHGSNSNENKELVITIEALVKTTNAFGKLPLLKESLLKVLENKTLVVMGYSCSDDFDVVPLLIESELKNIIWLNYDENYFPIAEKNIKNEKVLKIANKINLKYYSGRLSKFLKIWCAKKELTLYEGNIIPSYNVKKYIADCFESDISKIVLKNEIFLSYQFYNKVECVESSDLSKTQKLKALFRLNKLSEVIDLAESLLENNNDDFVKKEAFYYLGAGLHPTGDYEKAIDINKQALNLFNNDSDEKYCLSILINYAGSLYCYGVSLESDDGDKLVIDARNIYNSVLDKSEEISIEVKYTALWGLADIERCTGSADLAKELYNKTLIELEKIGNAYAIKLVKDILMTLN